MFLLFLVFSLHFVGSCSSFLHFLERFRFLVWMADASLHSSFTAPFSPSAGSSFSTVNLQKVYCKHAHCSSKFWGKILFFMNISIQQGLKTVIDHKLSHVTR